MEPKYPDIDVQLTGQAELDALLATAMRITGHGPCWCPNDPPQSLKETSHIALCREERIRVEEILLKYSEET